MSLSDANRKLGFLGKPGYDIFGNSEYFAPRVKWSELQKRVEEVKQQATDYETTFNEVMKIKNAEKNFEEVSSIKDRDSVRHCWKFLGGVVESALLAVSVLHRELGRVSNSKL